MNVIKPPRLRRGGLIGLVSPASTPVPATKIERSVRYLEGLGYRVTIGKHVAAVHGYLAGTDAQRAEDLNAMIRDSRVQAIFALRGGYGSPRILPLVDYRTLRRSPKIISGFSDITALQLAVFRKCRLVSFSGPMPAVEFWDGPDAYTEENFWRLVTSPKKGGALIPPPDDRLHALNPGRAEGVLLGGNLALVTSSIGTPYMPSARDALFVLEEVDEAPYRVDRMLAQLKNSGLVRKMNGLIFGQFTRCEQKDPSKPSLTIDEVLQEFTRDAGLPALSNLAYGHVPRKLTMPFGVRARMRAGKESKIELLGAAVE